MSHSAGNRQGMKRAKARGSSGVGGRGGGRHKPNKPMGSRTPLPPVVICQKFARFGQSCRPLPATHRAIEIFVCVITFTETCLDLVQASFRPMSTAWLVSPGSAPDLCWQPLDSLGPIVPRWPHAVDRTSKSKTELTIPMNSNEDCLHGIVQASFGPTDTDYLVFFFLASFGSKEMPYFGIVQAYCGSFRPLQAAKPRDTKHVRWSRRSVPT